MKQSFAVVAITKHGTALARKLHAQWPSVDVYYSKKFLHGDEETLGIVAFDESVMQLLPKLFTSYEGIISIISLGAMVRMIAPLLKDKKTDPAVVVIDDRGNYVISVLSGHLGGANELTRTVAQMLKATPVITTASDVSETIAVDLLGRNLGWEIEGFDQVTRVSAAIVNEEPAVVIQESGERNWWTYNKPLPSHIHVVRHLDEAKDEQYHAALWITHRVLTEKELTACSPAAVLYRPKVLVLGIGCNRDTTADEIERVISDTLATHQLAMTSVRNVATIDLKAHEPGLLSVCTTHHWPLVTYTAAELNEVPLVHPSETVFRYVGAYGVSEPAALRSAKAQDWLIEKVKSGNVTLSVCLVHVTD
ncbi:cobalt-precorrin 5A hydrolase [Sulfoacidibacillus ferrooxidans]|uniref:Cobalt-precorrin-5A hydrolase n=1 Tax=Sulfoacidibacillus ferrooxidans TaxID=2005001 RepID=A0A9X1V8A7_9BACL|nr:cobalamin biosynthesis protein [Sulfoacidibacillus ferrooxidans]MCI0183075.1 Cobalt-precorrin-5A hydrolase [Sulfoacidibacillus ferrooxidans]